MCMLAILLLPIAATADDTRDGNWWNNEDKGAKLYYVAGFLDGMSLGNKMSYWKMVRDKKNECMGASITSYSEYTLKFFAHVNAGQISDGLV